MHAPTNDADEDTKDIFDEQLQSVIDNIPRHDIIIPSGELNAKLGDKQEGEDGIVGNYGLKSERSDNGERLTAFGAINILAITSTMFKHKDVHKYIWTSPNGQHKNQIDHITTMDALKRSVLVVRAHRGADVDSDHNLVIIKIRLKLNKTGRKPTSSTGYEKCKPKVPEIRQRFQLELRNRFSALNESTTNDPEDVEQKWCNIKNAYNETAANILGQRKKRNQEWISPDSWKRVEEKQVLKGKLIMQKSERILSRYREQYSDRDKEDEV